MVIRNGCETTISSESLVVGDLVKIAAGSFHTVALTADGTVSSELAIAFLNASRSVAPNVAAVYPESVAAALIAVSGDSAAVGGTPEGRYVRKECTGRGQLKVRVDAIER